TRHLQHGEVDGARAGLHYDGGRVVSTRSDGPPTGERIVRLRTFGWSRVLRDCAVAFRRCESRQRDPGPDTSMMLTPKVPNAELQRSIELASKALLDCQQLDGHWVFELEVDATIPAEYVLLKHYLGEHDELGIESKIAGYLRRTQRAEGGWPLVYNGVFDLSASVKAYFALKMIGDRSDAEHMKRACQAILDHGGAARANAFTRVLLALYGILGWNNVPAMPVEIMLLPTWFPFHLSKISYWARTTIVPLLVLQALKPKARNPRGVRIDELFLDPPETARRGSKAPHQTWRW